MKDVLIRLVALGVLVAFAALQADRPGALAAAIEAIAKAGPSAPTT